MLPYGSPRRGTLTLGVLVLISFLLMTFDIRTSGSPGGLTQNVRDGAQTIFSPFQKAAQAVIDPVVEGFDSIANLASLREENDRLRAEREEMLAFLAEAEAAQAENNQLRTLLALHDQLPSYRLRAAEIISSGDSFDLRFTINRGAESGIVEGSPVIDDNGSLVGFIVEVGDTTSTVDPIIASGVFVQVRTEAGPGIIGGQGTENELRLEVYDATTAVRAGSVLQTFKNDNTPNGLNVATIVELAEVNVSKIDTNSVVPFVDFTRLQFVTVLGIPEDLSEDPDDSIPLETDESIPTESTVAGDS